jgi:hypothetical protein
LTSVPVQFFGRRHDEPFHVLWRPASKKAPRHEIAEGVWRRCRGRYGDFAAVSGLLRLDCNGCRDRLAARVVGYVGVNERSGRGATGLVARALMNPR